MQRIVFNTQLTKEEKEVHINYDYVDKKWKLDTTLIKYYNKAKKQGWMQTAVYVYPDGSVLGGIFEAPEYGITIRKPIKREVKKEQVNNFRIK